MTEHKCKYCDETFRTAIKLYGHHEYNHQDEWVDDVIEALSND